MEDGADNKRTVPVLSVESSSPLAVVDILDYVPL